MIQRKYLRKYVTNIIGITHRLKCGLTMIRNVKCLNLHKYQYLDLKGILMGIKSRPVYYKDALPNVFAK